MCCSKTFMRGLSVLAILAAICIVTSPTALAQCQASGSIPMFPQGAQTCGTGLLVGQTLDTEITLTNTSSTTGQSPNTPVSAEWTGSAIDVGLPGTDVYVNPGTTSGCVSSPFTTVSCTGGTGTTQCANVPGVTATTNCVIITS